MQGVSAVVCASMAALGGRFAESATFLLWKRNYSCPLPALHAEPGYRSQKCPYICQQEGNGLYILQQEQGGNSGNTELRACGDGRPEVKDVECGADGLIC